MWFAPFLIFVAVPLLELALLIKLGQWIGLWPTIVLIMLTAGLGLAILQRQGFAAFRRAAESMSRGTPPVEPVLDGFMLMLAGGLLIAPGLLTDIAGLLLLIPPVRKAAAKWWIARLMASGTIRMSTWRGRRPDAGSTENTPHTRSATGAGPVIEGEFERIDEKPRQPKTPGENPLKPQGNGHARDS